MGKEIKTVSELSDAGIAGGSRICRPLPGSARNHPLFMAEIHAVDEQRTAPRRRLLKSGRISFGGGAIDCTVRNLSEIGAALEVTSPVGIPEDFTLVIEADNTNVPCHVVWRKRMRIGVHFPRT